MLRITSCAAPNADALCQAITRYVGSRLKAPTEFVNDMPWRERERQFDAGDSWLAPA